MECSTFLHLLVLANVVECTGTTLASYGHPVQNSQLHTHRTAINQMRLLIDTQRLAPSAHRLGSTVPLPAGT